MNLAATLELYFGGPGSGCQGPNCGRPSTGIPMARFLTLELRAPHSGPTPFFNDSKTNWYWTPDKSHLVIEVEDEDEKESAIGMGEKTIYTVPKSNVLYFGPEEDSPSYRKKQGLGQKPGKEYGYVMDESERAA